MMSVRVSLVLVVLASNVLISACDSNNIKAEPSIVPEQAHRQSVEEAEALISSSDFARSKPLDKPIEITPPDVWERMKCQLFKLSVSGSAETFIVKESKAFHIGIGFGGFGVTSVVPYDVDRDGKLDIVYAYSFGSGLNRTLISWMDLTSFTEHGVEGIPLSEQQEPLILKVKGEEITAYRAESFFGRFAYPMDEDIAGMALRKAGSLIWEKDRLSYVAEALPNA